MSIQITTEEVKKLRDATGVSVMQCKKALEETEGDMEKAIMLLKKKSSDIASKKSDREALAGIVVIKQVSGKAVMLTLNCETDFVAKNDDFIALANKLADLALSDGIEATEAKSESEISPVVQKIGENIKLGGIQEYTGAVIGSYTHNGKAGVVVTLSGGTEDLARDIAMHIAAMKPEFATRASVPAESVEMARELFTKEVMESNKPEDMKAKILEGKVDAYFKDLTLVDQAFVKNPEKTVGQLLKESGDIEVLGFSRNSVI